MDARDVRAYASRPWTHAQAAKQRYWEAELRRRPQAAFEAAQALWAHMRMLRPDWPTEEERRVDLAHHLEVKRALARVAGERLAPSPR